MVVCGMRHALLEEKVTLFFFFLSGIEAIAAA